ncbi:hypothetical protein A5886_001462 [Enterococcus sp. 8G7_MSG3316]|uniref:MacB-like periplasmic core domain-containing protein n=1 Tax=Candidatus Enterococcus testudinis TaxID=1834191 RepID=A0A242A5S3_9ENTE|nr:ABC transporter permease [Enterococcus sp. 8G7_MSG3316]OTN76385.1 hypothetical protein A5886_001462 [Enterococcus sp. 8G7_MSG3316]
MKKIPYEYILYYFQLALVSFFILVLLCFHLDFQEKNFLKRGMFSENFIGFDVMNHSNQPHSFPFAVSSGVVLSKELIEMPQEIVRGYYGADIFGFADFLEEGVFIRVSDQAQKRPVAVLGKEMLSQTVVKNGRRYVGFHQQEFEVIGVFRETKTDLDFAVYLNLTALHREDIGGRYYIDGKNDAEVTATYHQIEASLASDIQLSKSIFREHLEFVMASRTRLLLLFALIAANANIIVTTIFFIYRQRYKVAVQKLCGMTKNAIALHYFKILLYISSLSFVTVVLLRQFLGSNHYSLFYLERLTWMHFGVLAVSMATLACMIVIFILFSMEEVNISDTLKGS